MKLFTPDISTETSQMLKEQTFGIGNLGVIFDILRNKLYKNPIMAICREYSCNARDAHREVRTPDFPIEISLPNAFSPHYKIKDFGPGINPDRMQDIFIKYAASTKRDDNIQTGCFGIGSKAAWSYSDIFSIITVVNNVKRVYNAYIDETQIGKMALASETKTDEPNGTTIVVPVKKHDYDEFVKCTIKATEFWNPRPILKGVSPAPEYQNPAVVLKGSDWELLAEHDYHKRKPKAIVDGIAYDISVDQIKNSDNSLNKYFNNYFVLYFNIGEVSLSASRDSIHYDDRTKKLLVNRFENINHEIGQIITDKVKNLPSYKEACCLVHDFLYQHGLGNFGNEIKNIQWNGHEVHPVISNLKIGRWSKIYSYSAFQKPVRGFFCDKATSSDNLNLKVKILFNDKTQERVDKNLISYIFEKNKNLDSVQVICAPTSPSSKVYKNGIKQNLIKEPVYDHELIKLISDDNLSSFSIPKNKKKALVKVKSTSVLAYHFGRGNTSPSITTIELDDTDTTKIRPYLTVDYKSREITSGSIVISDYQMIKDMETFLGKEIFGFSKPRAEKLGSQWIPLKTILESKIAEFEKQINISDLIEDGKSIGAIFENIFHIYNSNKFDNLLKTLSSNSLFYKYIKESIKVNDNIIKYDGLFKALHLCRGIDLPCKYTDKKSKLGILFSEVKKIYPMFYCMRNVLYNDLNDDYYLIMCFDYIKLIDEKQAKLLKMKKSA